MCHCDEAYPQDDYKISLLTTNKSSMNASHIAHKKNGNERDSRATEAVARVRCRF